MTLPLWLYWSGPSPAFDLGAPSMRRWLHEIVLREAAGPEDLASFLDREMLIALWPQSDNSKSSEPSSTGAESNSHPSKRSGKATTSPVKSRQPATTAFSSIAAREGRPRHQAHDSTPAADQHQRPVVARRLGRHICLLTVGLNWTCRRLAAVAIQAQMQPAEVGQCC